MEDEKITVRNQHLLRLKRHKGRLVVTDTNDKIIPMVHSISVIEDSQEPPYTKIIDIKVRVCLPDDNKVME